MITILLIASRVLDIKDGLGPKGNAKTSKTWHCPERAQNLMGLPSSLQMKRQPAILGNRSKLPKSTREELGGRNHYGCGWGKDSRRSKDLSCDWKDGVSPERQRAMFPTLLTGCKQVEGEQPPRWPLPSGTGAFAWGQIRSICVAVMQPQMLEQSLTAALHWAPTAYLSRTVIFR